jgi:hypothetical protein
MTKDELIAKWEQKAKAHTNLMLQSIDPDAADAHSAAARIIFGVLVDIRTLDEPAPEIVTPAERMTLAMACWETLNEPVMIRGDEWPDDADEIMEKWAALYRPEQVSPPVVTPANPNGGER